MFGMLRNTWRLGCGLGAIFLAWQAAAADIRILTAGAFNPGTPASGNGSVTNGQLYCVSANLGNIAPWDDLTANQYVSFLGMGTNSAGITVPGKGPLVLGILHA